VQWFVDTAPPPVPSILSTPENITIQTTASFTVAVEDDSPGTLGFTYTLHYSNGTRVEVAGGCCLLCTFSLLCQCVLTCVCVCVCACVCVCVSVRVSVRVRV
jgi:hypothetical protein